MRREASDTANYVNPIFRKAGDHRTPLLASYGNIAITLKTHTSSSRGKLSKMSSIRDWATRFYRQIYARANRSYAKFRSPSGVVASGGFYSGAEKPLRDYSAVERVVHL